MKHEEANVSLLLPQPFLIELWSNEYESSFALKLSTDQEDSFRAIVTKDHDDGNNSSSKFTKIVDMMYYDGSYHYDWSFMLEKWIEAWKSGFRHSSSIVPEFLKRDQKGNNSGGKGILSFEQKCDNNTKTKRPSRENDNNHKRNRQKPSLKCRYCGLMFVSERGREDHGREWHASKHGKSQ
jgi:hypothetical protein